MNDAEIRAAITVALMAAFADGLNDDRERAAVKALALRLGEGRIDLADVYEDVLARKLTIAQAVTPLGSTESRGAAYEAAVAIAAADGVHTPAETAFLSGLAAALGLPAPEADARVRQANAIAGAASLPAPAAGPPAAPGDARPDLPRSTEGRMQPDPAVLERQIVDVSITTAALELLPETLASLAILPLQIRLVYRIGQAYGYELDEGHIKEFAATLGVGLTGQYLEQFGRRILGGILGGVLGGIGRAAGHQAASSGMAFATTWAIGQVARQYYGAKRTLDAATLRAAFAPLLASGQQQFERYLPDIRQRAQSIDPQSLPALIRRL